MRGEEERGREVVEERKAAGEGRARSKGRGKRKRRSHEGGGEGEEELMSIVLWGSEMLPNEVRFSSMVSGQPHCPAEAPLGLMRDSGAWRLPITELSLF